MLKNKAIIVKMAGTHSGLKITIIGAAITAIPKPRAV